MAPRGVGSIKVYAHDLLSTLRVQAEQPMEQPSAEAGPAQPDAGDALPRIDGAEPSEASMTRGSSAGMRPAPLEAAEEETHASSRGRGTPGTGGLYDRLATPKRVTAPRMTWEPSARVLAHKAAWEARMRARDDQDRRDMERRRAQAAASRESSFATSLASVVRGIEGGEGAAAVLDDVAATTAFAAAARDKKQRAIHDAWSDRVYGVIQGQIDAELDSLSYADVSRRRQHAYDDFLTTVRRKASQNPRGGVYRDTVVDDYDPFAGARYIRVSGARDDDDPLHATHNKTVRERALFGDAVGAYRMRAATLRGDMLPSRMWDKLTATPYGHWVTADGSLDEAQYAQNLKACESNA